ncbi:MAG: tagaturonate reductase [Chryseolinea sp.]
MLKKLNRNAVPEVRNRPVKVLHFGDGNFIRAFIGWIIDVMNESTDFNGNIQVIAPLRNYAARSDEQDGLYHVALRGLVNGVPYSSTRLITSISETINPYTSHAGFLKAAENRKLEFVFSNSTEAGLAFIYEDDNVAGTAESFPGKVTQLLYHRYNHFSGSLSKGLIFIPCELVEKNGQKLQSIVLHYCEHWKLPAAFVQWVQEANIFCNTLVDRIVPGFPTRDVEEIQGATGYDDSRIVVAEPYHLLVVEGDKKLNALFPASKAGLSVKFVDNLESFRLQKVRILNGAHTSMMAFAYLRGLRTVKEAIDDPTTGAFIRQTIEQEIIPTLPLPANELKAYAADVMDRFGNPYIRHELASIALNSISKFKVRVLPTILGYINIKAALPSNLIRAFAALILFYRGEWRGDKMPVKDLPEVIAIFKAAWMNDDVESVVTNILSNTALWDQDLTGIDGMQEAVIQALHDLERI